MNDRKASSGKKLTGRPNQGKTETIRQRKVDVYLPTTELLQQWKEAAESSGMPLSKYILEVVEQHRQGVQEVTMPAALLEEKAKMLERNLSALTLRFETLNLAFHQQEVELSRLSSDYLSAKEGSLDVPMVRDLIQTFRSRSKEGWHFTDIWSSMKIDGGAVQRLVVEIKKTLPDLLVITDVCLCEYTQHGHCGTVLRRPDGKIDVDNDEVLQKWNEAMLFLLDVGLVTKDQDELFWWKNVR
jgi:hypothetical protein